MKGIKELQKFLKTTQNIVIITHQKPDGDAIGSSLALYHYLNQKGLQSSVIVPSDYASFLKWFPGTEAVINFERKGKKAEGIIAAADLIFCLDFNKLNRLNDAGKLAADSKSKKVLIDHHIDPDDFADYCFSFVDASSTSELIYDLIWLFGDLELINEDIATCIYTGIMTDTGSFRFSSTSARVHEVAADLLNRGADHSIIYGKIYETFKENRIRFVGFCLNEKLQIIPEYKTALIALTTEELKRFDVKTGDTEELVNYALNIREIVLSALIIDRSKLIKISLRSKGNFACNEIVTNYFSGGGHKNASGGESYTTLKETVEKFIKILPQYKDLLMEASKWK